MRSDVVRERGSKLETEEMIAWIVDDHMTHCSPCVEDMRNAL